MNSYTIKLTSKKEVAKDTMAFFFTKPKGFTYIAGQHCDFYLPEVPKSKNETGIRTFTLASAPFEKELMISCRMRRTTFKNRLNTMPIGSKITIGGLEGDFILPNMSPQLTSPPLVFIAGGIGITPFRSMILQSNNDNNQPQIFLFTANHFFKEVAFLDELKTVKNPHLKLIPIITKEKKWTGESGHISNGLLLKYLKSPKMLKRATFFVSGPPEMFRSVKKTLQKIGIKEEKIKTKEFTGY